MKLRKAAAHEVEDLVHQVLAGVLVAGAGTAVVAGEDRVLHGGGLLYSSRYIPWSLDQTLTDADHPR